MEFDQTAPPPEDVQLIWLEAPSNPMRDADDAELRHCCRASGAGRLRGDSTVGTPIYVRPLAQGCDIALHSFALSISVDTTIFCSVSALAAIRKSPNGSTRPWRQLGLTAAPDPAWLLLRSLETIELRVRRQTETARALGDRLTTHPAVSIVRYPGFGGLVSFDVADLDAASGWRRRTRMIVNRTSLGSTRTRMESRRRWEGRALPTRAPSPCLAGLENVEQLWTDLERALEFAGEALVFL